MSLSRELQLHIIQLQEIRSILNSMKNLAFMEIHKLQRFKAMQGQASANIERAALDFLAFYPALAMPDDNAAHIGVVLGAERGFCGDFNESLLHALTSQTYAGVIAIGSRLCNRLEDISVPVIATLEGANVAEEVTAIINRLIDALSVLQAEGAIADGAATLQLSIVYHDNAANQIRRRQLLPPFLDTQPRSFRYGSPPVLNLKPGEFFADLVDHYLLAVLHEIFYISLMAENNSRLHHLEGAVNHLDDETVRLQRKSQIYRQEEITEEIEVILLNAENL